MKTCLRQQQVGCGCGDAPLTLELRRQRQTDLWELQASMVSRVNSRARETLSQKTKTKPQKVGGCRLAMGCYSTHKVLGSKPGLTTRTNKTKQNKTSVFYFYLGLTTQHIKDPTVKTLEVGHQMQQFELEWPHRFTRLNTQSLDGGPAWKGLGVALLEKVCHREWAIGSKSPHHSVSPPSFLLPVSCGFDRSSRLRSSPSACYSTFHQDRHGLNLWNHEPQMKCFLTDEKADWVMGFCHGNRKVTKSYITWEWQASKQSAEVEG